MGIIAFLSPSKKLKKMKCVAILLACIVAVSATVDYSCPDASSAKTVYVPEPKVDSSVYCVNLKTEQKWFTTAYYLQEGDISNFPKEDGEKANCADEPPKDLVENMRKALAKRLLEIVEEMNKQWEPGFQEGHRRGPRCRPQDLRRRLGRRQEGRHRGRGRGSSRVQALRFQARLEAQLRQAPVRLRRQAHPEPSCLLPHPDLVQIRAVPQHAQVPHHQLREQDGGSQEADGRQLQEVPCPRHRGQARFRQEDPRGPLQVRQG